MTHPRGLLLLAIVAGTAACTAILGDFSVGDALPSEASTGADATTSPPSQPDAESPDSDAAAEADADAGSDAGPDADAGPPPPDGGLLAAYNFASCDMAAPGNIRVAFDPGGNLLVLFAFIQPTNVLGTQLFSHGSFDVGLAKIAPNGNLVWAKHFGTAEQDFAGGLAVDGAGDVYISGGSRSAAIHFGGATSALTRASNTYIGWIAKIDGATGFAKKAIAIDTPANDGAVCQSLVARGGQIAAMCGVFGPTTFPGAGGPLTSAPPYGTTSSAGIVVARLDGALTASWTNSLGSTEADVGANVALAANDDVLVVANTYNAAAATFGDSKGTIMWPLSGPNTAVIARFAASTGAALWSKAFNAPTSGNLVQFNGVAVDSQNRVVVVGSAVGSVALGAQNPVSAGSHDMLIATFDGANGTPTSAKTYGGAVYDEGSAVAVDSLDFFAVAGRYMSAGMSFDGKSVPDPFPPSMAGAVFRAGPDLNAAWAAGLRSAALGTELTPWSVATDPATRRVAAAGTFKGIVDFGDDNPRKSWQDGGAYDIWVTVRAP